MAVAAILEGMYGRSINQSNIICLVGLVALARLRRNV